MGILYLVVFSSIGWLWRPTGQNLRLSMSDEIGQDEGFDGEDYEIGEFGQHETMGGEDDEETGKGGAQANATSRSTTSNAQGRTSSRVADDAEEDVMFEIGEDDDDGQTPRKTRDDIQRQAHRGTQDEHEGLMTEAPDNDSRETLVPDKSNAAARDNVS
jgi:hypothetical protein